MRLLVPLLGLLLIGFCVQSTFMEWTAAMARTTPVDCHFFTDQPLEEWITLSGCNVVFEDAVLSDGADVFERYADRREGLSRSLHDTQPVWTTIYAPIAPRIKPVEAPGHAVRAVIAITDHDALDFVNSLERAPTQREREHLLERPRQLDRLSHPPLLAGKASRLPVGERVQRVLGAISAPTLTVLEPGTVPPAAVSGLAFFAGAFGLFMVLMGVRTINHRSRSVVDDAQVINTSDVRVEVGELAALREEERLAKQQQRPGGDPPTG